MVFQSLRDIEEALRPGTTISARELYAIWGQRLAVQIAAKKQTADPDFNARPLEWLQNDLEVVTAFTAQALAQQEYLLVCDAFVEAHAYWNHESRKNTPGWLKYMALLTSHCAEAKTRLGFTVAARNLLEPLANHPNLGRREQAKILLQIGNILREESHYTPDPASRRIKATTALEIYQKVLSFDEDLIDAHILNAAMLLITSPDAPTRLQEAHTSARQVIVLLDRMENESGSTFRTLWFRAVALSILGRLDESLAYYARLKDVPHATTAELAEARYRSQFLAEALDQPRRYFYQAFPPLQLLVFAGPLPDRAGYPPRFPLESIPQVRLALREKLDHLGARVGLVCAAAGADLLFLEALHERPGAQYHVILPWSKEEFFRTSVAPYEPEGQAPLWKPIFDRALEKATTLRELGQVYEPSDDVGWEYTQEVTAGIALLTARTLRLDVQPIALWDGSVGRGVGGTNSFVELWRQQLQQEPEIVKLPLHQSSVPNKIRHLRTERPTMRQEVKSMLFADIVGYSKLTEKVIGDFVEVFMQRLSILLSTHPHAPRSINTWGDAIYGVFDFSDDAGLFALALTKMVREGEADWRKKGLVFVENGVEFPLNIRVGLHTGPVLALYNPILRQVGYTGSHVNRAARIEPIAERGEVYASEEFAAMAELGKTIRQRNPTTEKPLRESFLCEYAGSKALAKSYPGLFHIYRVIPERNLAIEELAQAAHQLYCEEQARQGKTAADNIALRPWQDLDEDKRDANRAQVADIPSKLYQLGYELAPSSGLSPSQLVITAEQLERLAQHEHERWMAERRRQGWTYGTPRDDARKHHPSMIRWELLSEAEKQKDRDTVNNLPALIKRAGFQIRKSMQ